MTLARVRRRHVAESVTDRQLALSSVLAQIELSARSLSDARPSLLAESGGRMHMLDSAQVELVEADRNYVKLVIGRTAYHARSTLHQAEKSLQSQPMLRISRSRIVNMVHVRELSRTPRGDFILVLTGGMTVTSSEGFRESVRGYLEQFRLKPG